MKDYLDLLALRTGYIYIFVVICIFFIIISLIIIGRCQYLVKRFSKEYYPAEKYQKNHLLYYDKNKTNIYIRSDILYKYNPELNINNKNRNQQLPYYIYNNICQLSKDNNIILLAPDIDDKECDRSLYKYIQYIEYHKLPITRIITIIPDNVKIKEKECKNGTFTYLVKER